MLNIDEIKKEVREKLEDQAKFLRGVIEEMIASDFKAEVLKSLSEDADFDMKEVVMSFLKEGQWDYGKYDAKKIRFAIYSDQRDSITREISEDMIEEQISSVFRGFPNKYHWDCVGRSELIKYFIDWLRDNYLGSGYESLINADIVKRLKYAEDRLKELEEGQ